MNDINFHNETFTNKSSVINSVQTNDKIPQNVPVNNKNNNDVDYYFTEEEERLLTQEDLTKIGIHNNIQLLTVNRYLLKKDSAKKGIQILKYRFIEQHKKRIEAEKVELARLEEIKQQEELEAARNNIAALEKKELEQKESNQLIDICNEEELKGIQKEDENKQQDDNVVEKQDKIEIQEMSDINNNHQLVKEKEEIVIEEEEQIPVIDEPLQVLEPKSNLSFEQDVEVELEYEEEKEEEKKQEEAEEVKISYERQDYNSHEIKIFDENHESKEQLDCENSHPFNEIKDAVSEVNHSNRNDVEDKNCEQDPPRIGHEDVLEKNPKTGVRLLPYAESHNDVVYDNINEPEVYDDVNRENLLESPDKNLKRNPPPIYIDTSSANKEKRAYEPPQVIVSQRKKQKVEVQGKAIFVKSKSALNNILTFQLAKRDDEFERLLSTLYNKQHHSPPVRQSSTKSEMSGRSNDSNKEQLRHARSKTKLHHHKKNRRISHSQSEDESDEEDYRPSIKITGSLIEEERIQELRDEIKMLHKKLNGPEAILHLPENENYEKLIERKHKMSWAESEKSTMDITAALVKGGAVAVGDLIERSRPFGFIRGKGLAEEINEQYPMLVPPIRSWIRSVDIPFFNSTAPSANFARTVLNCITKSHSKTVEEERKRNEENERSEQKTSEKQFNEEKAKQMQQLVHNYVPIRRRYVPDLSMSQQPKPVAGMNPSGLISPSNFQKTTTEFIQSPLQPTSFDSVALPVFATNVPPQPSPQNETPNSTTINRSEAHDHNNQYTISDKRKLFLAQKEALAKQSALLASGQ